MPNSIGYVDATWNPVTGCSPVSEGCTNCWAARMAKRLAGRAGYPKDDPFKPTFHGPKSLDIPYFWKKSKRIATCFMGDLFHPDVLDEHRDAVFTAMSCCHWHTFLLLTKRPEIAAEYTNQRSGPELPNVWLGTSIENQERADERVPWLLRCKAILKWVSIEPQIGPVSFRWTPYHYQVTNQTYREYLEERGEVSHVESLMMLDWVVCGCESGPKARPFDLDWARQLRHECEEAKVPFYLKQVPDNSGHNRTVIHRPLLDGVVWDQLHRQEAT